MEYINIGINYLLLEVNASIDKQPGISNVSIDKLPGISNVSIDKLPAISSGCEQ